MKDNILLRLSEAARTAVRRSAGNEAKRFDIEKTLALFLWFLVEWEKTASAKKPVAFALDALWDVTTGNIDRYLEAGGPAGVNAVLTEMSAEVAKALA